MENVQKIILHKLLSTTGLFVAMVIMLAREQCDMTAQTPQVATEPLLNFLSDNIIITIKKKNWFRNHD